MEQLLRGAHDRRITKSTMLVEVWDNPNGSLPVAPYVYGNAVVGCSYVGENTVVSLD